VTGLRPRDVPDCVLAVALCVAGLAGALDVPCADDDCACLAFDANICEFRLTALAKLGVLLVDLLDERDPDRDIGALIIKNMIINYYYYIIQIIISIYLSVLDPRCDCCCPCGVAPLLVVELLAADAVPAAAVRTGVAAGAALATTFAKFIRGPLAFTGAGPEADVFALVLLRACTFEGVLPLVGLAVLAAPLLDA
jgi:hypothetical protein